MPNNKKDLTDKLENCLFEFVWKKFCKFTRNEAELPPILRGLGFPDLKSTWMAFEFFHGWCPLLQHTKCSTYSVNIKFWSEVFLIAAGFINEMGLSNVVTLVNSQPWVFDIFPVWVQLRSHTFALTITLLLNSETSCFRALLIKQNLWAFYNYRKNFLTPTLPVFKTNLTKSTTVTLSPMTTYRAHLFYIQVDKSLNNERMLVMVAVF